ncbi:MAG: response regulator [Aliidiomarina sp.]
MSELSALPEKLSVLVAEDNQASQLIIRYFLQSLGAICTIVSNGEQAVIQAREGTFDLIILDAMMPIVDGIKAVEMIRAGEDKAASSAPIFLLTADAVGVEQGKYAHLDIQGTLTKPYTRTELANALMQLFS